MLARVWFTNEDFPTSQETIDLALAAGAEQVLHGIPESMSHAVPAGTLGYYEVEFPDPPQETEQETLNVSDAEEALALMVLCIADGDMEGAQMAAQLWREALGL